MTAPKSSWSLGKNTRPRIGIVVPHIFMQDMLLPDVIFSPGDLALSLANGLASRSVDVTLYSPGAITTSARNITGDMSSFESELSARGYGYIELLKKHPLTFVSLARQVQAELIARAYADANSGKLDIVHIYTNEEDIALPFSQFCAVPVVFTHHDPFRLLVRYKHVFPKYHKLRWISLSYAQRAEMPEDTNWVANIYHGLDTASFEPTFTRAADVEPYVVFLGRIIESKGTHLAMKAVRQYNDRHPEAKLRLKIAGRHYAGSSKDAYWQDAVLPLLDDDITYIGPIRTLADKQALLGGAVATMMPSVFAEPFGMVAIESMACATPVIGIDSGAIREVIGEDAGIVVPRTVLAGTDVIDESRVATYLRRALEDIGSITRHACRSRFEYQFTADRMCDEHMELYAKLVHGHN